MMLNRKLEKLSQTYQKQPTKSDEEQIIHLVESDMNNAGHERMLWHAERVRNTVRSVKILCFLLILMVLDHFAVSLVFSALISLSITLIIKDYLAIFTIALYEKRVIEKDQFAVYWRIKAIRNLEGNTNERG